MKILKVALWIVGLFNLAIAFIPGRSLWTIVSCLIIGTSLIVQAAMLPVKP